MKQNIKTEEIFPVIYLCVVYGVRRGEVLGIKWDSIDFERKLITIRHTVVCYNKVYEKNTTKTQSSYRSYPMSEDIIELVNKAKEREERNRRLFGKEYCENVCIQMGRRTSVFTGLYHGKIQKAFLEK